MYEHNFMILEEANNLPSSVELSKLVNKYAPRILSTEFSDFIRMIYGEIPEEFYPKNKVTVCSTSNTVLVDFIMRKYNSSIWKARFFVVRSQKKDAHLTFYYYLDDDNFVALFYTKSFYIKQQSLPYAVSV